MAHACDRHPLNASGSWYVKAEDCVACETCSGIAPQIFAHDEHGVAYVAHNLAQEPRMRKLYEEAVENCPSGAISGLV